MTHTSTRTVFIGCAPEVVFDFLVDPLNWPRYAVHSVKSVKPGKSGSWILETPRGEATLRLKANRELGVLDHEVVDDREGEHQIPARVVPISQGALFMITITRPLEMPEDTFAVRIRELDEELQQLRTILEG